MAKLANDEMNKFKEVTKMTYNNQATFFLNAFWKEYSNDAEQVWKYAQKFVELDPKKKEGCDLDEFNAHRFLEQVGETKRVVELRETLRQIDLDFNKRMALIEYLLFRYSQSIKELLSRPQGDNQEEVQAAQAKLKAVQDAMEEVQRQLDAQQKALDEQKKALEEQKRTEEAVKQAEADQRAAVEELKKQEDSYKNAVTTLENKSKDTNIGLVQRNKAAAELAQLKQEDPLPLRKAKITQEAALRKVEKERQAAEAATAQAEAKTAALEEQTKKVEAAYRETEARFKEAQDYLEEVKRKGGVAFGDIWWMERELKEAQKYLPKSKQK